MSDINFQLLSSYSKNIIISLVLFIVVGLEIRLINKASIYLKDKVLNFKSTLFKIQSFELISHGQQQLIILGMINFVRIAVIFISVNFSLLFILSLFPFTSRIVSSLIDFVAIPVKESFYSVLDYLPNLFSIIIILFIFRYILKFVKILSKELQKGTIHFSTFNPLWIKTTAKIINFILFAFMLIMIMPLLPGYKSSAFTGVAAFLGALLTIGGSSVIANFMSGIVVSYMNPCQLGDFIKIDDTAGQVIEMSNFAIKIRTPKKVLVSIPFAKVLGSHIINYSGNPEDAGILLHTTISIGYDVTWEKVNELLLSAASSTEYIDNSNPPFVRQIKLDDFYIVYELNAYTTNVKQMHHTYSELHKHILDVFDQAKIEILSPHYRSVKNQLS